MTPERLWQQLQIMPRFESWWPTCLPKGWTRRCAGDGARNRRCICGTEQRRVSLGELAAKLKLDKSATSRRLRGATDRGYLVNLETRRGRPARIVLGDPMPEMVKLLPEPGELAA
jgi:hypothetical protein